MAQLVKNLPSKRETPVGSLGQEDPLEKGMATQSSILAWRTPWTEETEETSPGVARPVPVLNRLPCSEESGSHLGGCDPSQTLRAFCFGFQHGETQT